MLLIQKSLSLKSSHKNFLYVKSYNYFRHFVTLNNASLGLVLEHGTMVIEKPDFKVAIFPLPEIATNSYHIIFLYDRNVLLTEDVCIIVRLVLSLLKAEYERHTEGELLLGMLQDYLEPETWLDRDAIKKVKVIYQIGILNLEFDSEKGFPMLKNPEDMLNFPVLLEGSEISSYDELEDDGLAFLERVTNKLSNKLLQQLNSKKDDKSFFNIVRFSVVFDTK